jgi:predicted ATPase/DNA-binding CsgD family transcriptional regulator
MGDVGGVPGAARLPVGLARLFGRDAEVAELLRLVDEERLLTLVGAPGCGKTRLAIEVAAPVAAARGGGVRFVELGPVGDPALVAHAVGAALGAAEQPDRSMADVLVDALYRTDPVLVVLDNCEHVIDAAAALAHRLVVACPPVSVLATSRAALAVPGERVWRVPPLEVAAAVELFEDRALGASGVADLGRADRAVVEDICARLGGLPLAIELTAAWGRVLSPGQILDRLVVAGAAVPASSRAREPRHDTMATAIDWSYRLLPTEAQRMFQRLSVFAGSFDLDAVAAVAGREDPTGALAWLTLLVDHSMVLATRVAGQPMRYGMLEPVRQHAGALLAEAGESDAVRRWHFDHYLDLVERWHQVGFPVSPQPVRLHRLVTDGTNLLAALEWARRQPSDLGLRLGATLGDYFVHDGQLNAARRWLDEALAKGTDDPRLRSWALREAGGLAWRQGDYESARAYDQAALEIARSIGDPLLQAAALHALTFAELSAGDIAAALDHGQQALTITRACGDERTIGFAELALGWAGYAQGDPVAGDEHMHGALAANRDVGDSYITAHAHLGLQFGACLAGDAEAQRAHLVATLAAVDSGAHIERTDWLWAALTLAAHEGRAHTTVRLLGAVGVLEQGQGGIRAPAQFAELFAPLFEQAVRYVRPALVERLLDQGRQMRWDDLVADVLAEPGARHPTLTPREHEIAELVAEGLSNATIAEKLVISPRTVESHVDHIKRKLGLDARGKIIVWVLSAG